MKKFSTKIVFAVAMVAVRYMRSDIGASELLKETIDMLKYLKSTVLILEEIKSINGKILLLNVNQRITQLFLVY